jgi:hypothetical protein
MPVERRGQVIAVEHGPTGSNREEPETEPFLLPVLQVCILFHPGFRVMNVMKLFPGLVDGGLEAGFSICLVGFFFRGELAQPFLPAFNMDFCNPSPTPI